MKTAITKIFLILSVMILILTSFGCGGSLENVTDEAVKTGLLEYSFIYFVNAPGVGAPTYKVLWDGYDEDNPCGGPSYPKEYRKFTYLTEYLPTDSGYYVVYLKKDLINNYLGWLKEHEEKNISGYRFSKYDAGEIIDGKYFYCYQRFGEGADALKIFKADNLSDIDFMSGDYQLVFCCQTKKAIIKENLSEGREINKQITLYNRFELIFDDLNKAPVKYTFPEPENKNQENEDKWFSYEGEYIASYDKEYEEKNCGFYSKMNHAVREAKVVVEDGNKYVLLPRYALGGSGERVDLLEQIEDVDKIREDVFREYKENFKAAYVKEVQSEGSNTLYALYKYDAVIDVIRD